MLAEIKQSKPDLNVEILGVNRSSDSRYNHYITEEFSLPWLQDTDSAAVWSLWNVEYRDVKILDAQNRLVATFNVTQFDLSSPEHYNRLKQLFLATAVANDADKDQLPDAWEVLYLPDRDASPNADPDQDGVDNLTEFVFGSDPAKPDSRPALQIGLRMNARNPVVQCKFVQPAGHLFSYSIESSSDLKLWTPISPTSAANPKNLFTGTGTWESTLSVNAGTEPHHFFRIRALAR